MKRVPTHIVKERSRQLTRLVDSFSSSCEVLLGSRQRVWVTDVAADGHKLTGHTKNYTQVGVRVGWLVVYCLLKPKA
jgi:threonylcarbamoyladenosine tRNA methylthiotransferase CDKAL1